ncbi:MAG: enoyl-CoA hydratase/isomerase family protein [Burkholderiales bacterium]|nr:enoyl-CoA hydratase/isomerase family protein [Burkholderiales bacterium]OUT76828.1 MAG: 2-(1,2-epoxy-1,2-dihydrophenyl)acetyl-CoA isomerase [Betaproteobacteria bacterium TMED22]|tara:strand:+ start:27707 stop:28498 length:792 start_codon:yes stop_codon:yes gene_type:complete
MSFEQLSFQVTNGISTITLNQPESLNSFTTQMLSELTEALSKAENDPQVRVIVLTGSGRAFCAGQNLNERKRSSDQPKYDIGQSLRERYVPIVTAIRSSKKPVIGAINGIAAGAGANVALACDLVIAKESASFLQAFTRIGLMPDAGGTFFLTRAAGRQKAMGMALLAQPVTAEDAESWGLIWKAVPDQEFNAEINRISEQLAKGPALAYARTKQAILAAEKNDFTAAIELECDLQAELGYSDDYEEGVNAFKEKRPAIFRGK